MSLTLFGELLRSFVVSFALLLLVVQSELLNALLQFSDALLGSIGIVMSLLCAELVLFDLLEASVETLVKVCRRRSLGVIFLLDAPRARNGLL